MPSAGRPFTSHVLTELAGRDVEVAEVTLHTGVSSPERHEAPYPERFDVPAATARAYAAQYGSGVGAARVTTEPSRFLVPFPNRTVKRRRADEFADCP